MKETDNRKIDDLANKLLALSRKLKKLTEKEREQSLVGTHSLDAYICQTNYFFDIIDITLNEYKKEQEDMVKDLMNRFTE